MKLRYLAIAFLLITASAVTFAESLVILHTNDTHSQIDPDDQTGLGGVARRKVLIDSVRAANKNVMLIDAGDAVQGTLFFNLDGGEVENKIMDALGYDLRILGNHEFDNGTDSLWRKIKDTDAEWLSTNYRFTDPRMDARFKRYVIREFDGKRIGFIALNLQPHGMISEGNYDGVEYVDMYEAANSAAWLLKNVDGCDMVVAVTHIGYDPSNTGTSDVELAAKSRNIDIIIGGHSHTVVDPAATVESKKPYSRHTNADGKPVLVVQTGKSGRNLGQITIDLDNQDVDYVLMPVSARLDSLVDPTIETIVKPYRDNVDWLMTLPLTKLKKGLDQKDAGLLNFVADYIAERGQELSPNAKIDLAITNVGGIRRGLPTGNVSRGMIMQMLPFNNKVEVIDLLGKDLLDNFAVMTNTGGNGISKSASVTYDAKTGKIVSARINGKPIDPNKTYRVATIDYLANGGDYMEPLTRGKRIAASPSKLSDDLLGWIDRNYKDKTLPIDNTVRFKKK